MGLEVLLAGRRETLDRPDPVGPHRSTEQSVFLGLDVDQVSANIVHPGVEMSRIQPVADGPSGSDRRRRPVGTDEMYAVHDEVRPTAGGPVGRFPDPGPLKYSKMSSPDDSYQPLVTGPLGTNEMNAINDLSRLTAGGPLGRPFSLDPMGPGQCYPWATEISHQVWALWPDRGDLNSRGTKSRSLTINGRLRQEVSRKVIPVHQIP